MSVIIVGVGNADFSNMERLDADKDPLVASNGVKAARDLVQFVPMRDVARQGPGAVAELTLAEIPTQVLQFMALNRVMPMQPREYVEVKDDENRRNSLRGPGGDSVLPPHSHPQPHPQHQQGHPGYDDSKTAGLSFMPPAPAPGIAQASGFNTGAPSSYVPPHAVFSNAPAMSHPPPGFLNAPPPGYPQQGQGQQAGGYGGYAAPPPGYQ